MNYKIAAYDVDFPHKAYGVQLGFMEKVLKALDGKTNALLEAPTGSGKTLSLLCAALAWQRQQKIGLCKAEYDVEVKGEPGSDVEEPQDGEVAESSKQKKRCTRIYYATRTHSQIAQVRCASEGALKDLEGRHNSSALPGGAGAEANLVQAKNGHPGEHCPTFALCAVPNLAADTILHG